MLKDGFKASYTTIPFAIYKKIATPDVGAFVAHHHREVEIISLKSGSAEFTVDSESFILSPGDTLVIPPYAVHRGKIDPDTAYNCVCFDLSLLWDERLRNDLENGELTVLSPIYANTSDAKDLALHVESAMTAFIEKYRGWEMEVIGRMSLVFAAVCRCEILAKSEHRQKETIFCKKVIDYVLSHYSEPITSATAAAALYINNSYFCRLFKKNFECNFSDFVNQYRIERAKVLLNNNDLSVSEVAIETGFNSFSYFCKIFKSTVGISPSDFRKRLENNAKG